MNLRRFFLLFVACAASAQTVTNLHFDSVSHSDVRLIFNVSAAYANARVRYLPSSSGSCTGGAGGTVQRLQGGFMYTTNMTIVVGGMAASTQYQLCPEVTTNNTTWTTGVGVLVTTLALPAIHPVAPAKPTIVDTSYPDTSGYSAPAWTGCAGLNTLMNNAIAQQTTNGTIINIPAGTVCTGGQTTFYQTQIPPDAKTVASTSINVNGNITIAGHGFAEGKKAIWSLSAAGQFPAYSSTSLGACPDPMTAGVGYINDAQPWAYIHVVDANTIQFYCNAPFGQGGTLMSYTNQGASNTYVVQYPRTSLKWIIVRTATPDSQFAPVGTRVNLAWEPKMAIFQKTTTGGYTASWDTMFNVGNMDQPSTNHNPIGKIRFVGLEFTTADYTGGDTSTDPVPWGTLLNVHNYVSDIIFDRCIIRPHDSTNRITGGLYWAGWSVAIVDSYLTDLLFWHATYSGYGVAQASTTQLTVGAGTYNMTPRKPSVTMTGTATVNLTGTGTGVGMVYMTIPGVLTISVPPGSGGTCSGGSVTCSVVVQTTAATSSGGCGVAEPNWPRNAAGNWAVGKIACFNLASGLLTNKAWDSGTKTINQADGTTSVFVSEGSNFMIGGIGPGPYTFIGNYVEGVGLTWHHDDSGAFHFYRDDFYYYRNTFRQPFKYQYGGGVGVSNGFRYYNRQPLEWKAGHRIWIDGNIFDGAWSEDTGASTFICFTPRNGYSMSDVAVTNNSFLHGPGVLEGPLVVPDSNFSDPVTQVPPPNRYLVQNNLAMDIHGCNYRAPFQAGQGWFMEGPAGGEDFVLDHNTVIGQCGNDPVVFYASDQLFEGMTVTNNVFQLGPKGGIDAFDYTTCSGQSGAAAFNCVFPIRSTFTKNILMLQSGTSAAQMAAYWPDGTNYVPNVSYAALGYFHWDPAVAFGKYTSGMQGMDFHWKVSTYVGTDLDYVGVNIDRMEAEQGKTTLNGVSGITSSGATIAYVAPDADACSVDYSSQDPAIISSFNRQDDSGGGRVRNVTISGLSTQTRYYYRVNCAVQQLTGLFKTR